MIENNLYQRFIEYIDDNSLVTKDTRVLLAVSGGVDSMVMLSLFVSAGYDIAVAHCNFQLRGEESSEDEVLVGEQAHRYGIPFFNRRFDTTGQMEITGESVQLAARRLRYEWFAELCREKGYDVISVAHHADDSIETFFINMFRGTGLKGLTGISTVNGDIIRPLMFATRREILDYAVRQGIRFREDSSNRSTKYLRNKIRLGLVPLLREISPSFTNVMVRNIQRLTDAQLFINGAMDAVRDRVEEKDGTFTYIYPDRIEDGLPVGFVLYELLVAYGFKGDVIDSIHISLRDGSSGKRFYSLKNVAYTDRGRIIVAPIEDHDSCAVEVEAGMRRAYCGNSVLHMRVLDIDEVDVMESTAEIALLDADKLAYPLEIRRWQDGDAFIPLGMTGHKKISDYLIDSKVPVAEKKRQFVVLSGGEIVWLVGRRIDNRFRITSQTENVLKIGREII